MSLEKWQQVHESNASQRRAEYARTRQEHKNEWWQEFNEKRARKPLELPEVLGYAAIEQMPETD